MDFIGNESKMPELDVRRYWMMLRVWKFYVIATALIVWVGFAIVAVRLPNVYRSETAILVEPPKVSTSYVQPIITSRMEDRLSTIKEQILSRPNLERIIQEQKLYGWKDPAGVTDKMIQAIRNDISITVSGNNTFKIAYESRDPDVARNTANRLASSFIEENLRSREQQTSNTSEFLENQMEQARKRLEAQETNLKNYKLQHMGELPEQSQANLRTLDRLQYQLQSSSDASQRAQERKLFIERLLASLESQTRSPMPAPGEGEIRSLPAATPENPLVAQWRVLQATQAELSVQYKESHPDLIRLRKQIAKLEQRIAAQPKSTGDATPPVVNPTDRLAISDGSWNSAETQKKISELRTELESLINQITFRAQEQAQLGKELAGYQSKVDQTPKIEQDLMAIVRDYDITKANYRSLLEKKLSSGIAENLERTQKGEQFRIIEPASAPERPSRPSRWLIVLAGLILGPILGAALAFGRDYLDHSLRNEADIQRFFGLPVMATIPEIETTRNGFHNVAHRSAGNSRSNKAPVPSTQWPSLSALDLTSDIGRFFGYNENGAEKLVMLTDLRSLASEQYRFLGLQVLGVKSALSSKSLLITSATIAEGKTLVTLNLALALVMERCARVLVVDADLRKAGLNSFIRQKPAEGLTDLLEFDRDYRLSILPTPLNGLFLLPAGRISSTPVGHLSSVRMAKLLARWERDFDIVLLDSPPLLPVPDSVILSQLTNRTLLVVRANVTPREAVQKALEEIPAEKRMGILLNRMYDFSISHYYTQYYGLDTNKS